MRTYLPRTAIYQRRSLAGILLAIFLLGLAAPAAAAPHTLFVSLLPQKQMVEAVTGDLAEVEVLVPPGQSPATFEPGPRQMTRLSDALAYFSIGAPFEDSWLPRLEQAHPDVTFVDTREGIELMTIAQHLHAVPEGSTLDPKRLDRHIWVSPRRMIQQTRNVRDALIKLLPAHAEQLQSNAQRHIDALETLDRDMAETLRKVEGRAFMVFHPAWGYLASDYGLRQIPIEMDGREPGPRALQATIETARAEEVKVIFVQRQFNQDVARAVADAVDAEIVAIDPLAENFLANMRHIAEVLAKWL
ncbi:MAG: zinc ABC transporter substrate-binding protein [Halomonas sp.]|uniref:metal ABC transporter solute-binding protein, Zn/Mn family n=1 Tax=Halomonas sp. TaxID=1486246 RepID=UPI00286FE70E|nr:zinc ABC transporter substrate-binding protein [Halomonas sp.]MDR9438571.1 zinc ABC transporter substrate-binding protein [Halomonas sp.]